MKILKTAKRARVIAGEVITPPVVTEIRPLPVSPDAMRDSGFPERSSPVDDTPTAHNTYSHRRRP